MLTPERPSQNGISIETISGVTHFPEKEWDLEAIKETNFNMKLHLNKTWSFDPNFITKLTLQIGSDTSTQFSNSLILSFSQNNAKYITSVTLHISTNHKYKTTVCYW